MKIRFRILVQPATLFAFLIAIVPAWVNLARGQGDYPSRPVRIVVPYPPGGNSDPPTRLFARSLSEMLGQQFIIDNRPGNGSNMGAEFVARSAPDGYTLYVVQVASHGINPSLFGKLSYDPIKDFAAVGFMARTPMFLVINSSLPVNSVQDLVKYARERPGQLSFASAGNGSPQHLAGALFRQRAGIDILHVPYKGSAQAIVDLIGGQVQIMFDARALTYAREGKLKVLAIADSKRWPSEPQIPSMTESGFPDVEVTGYFGLAAPARTPEPILQKLNDAMVNIAKREETRKRLEDMLLGPLSGTRSEMTTFMINQIEKWRPIVKAAGAKLE